MSDLSKVYRHYPMRYLPNRAYVYYGLLALLLVLIIGYRFLCPQDVDPLMVLPIILLFLWIEFIALPIVCVEISAEYIHFKYRLRFLHRIVLWDLRTESYTADFAAVVSFIDKTEGIGAENMLHTALIPIASYEMPLMVDSLAFSHQEVPQDKAEAALLRQKIAAISGLRDEGFIGLCEKNRLRMALREKT